MLACQSITRLPCACAVHRHSLLLVVQNIFEYPPTGNISAPANSVAHDTLARTLAERSMTLLQNNGGLLPLDVKTIKSIAVFGDQTTVTGGGSGGVQLPYVITPYQGIVSYVNNGLPPRPANCVTQNDTDYYQPGESTAQLMRNAPQTPWQQATTSHAISSVPPCRQPLRPGLQPAGLLRAVHQQHGVQLLRVRCGVPVQLQLRLRWRRLLAQVHQ